MVSSECTVRSEGLVKIYPSGTRALKGVSLEMDPGVHAIMGPNGSGKTTFLSIAAGALAPSEGSISVCGHEVWGRGWREARLATGYAPQVAPFRDRLTLLENLIWYASLRGMGLSSARDEARMVLERLGLLEKAGERVQRLSGGMRRKAIIAAALVARPRVLLLDEPSSGLDPNARRELWRYLYALVEEGLVETLVYTTHLAEEAEKHSKKVHVFHRGNLVASGEPRELVSQHAPSPFIVVSFQGRVEEGSLSGLDGVDSLSISGNYLSVRTREPENLLPRLVERLIKAGVMVERVEVRRLGLEEVFYTLTGARLGGS